MTSWIDALIGAPIIQADGVELERRGTIDIVGADASDDSVNALTSVDVRRLIVGMASDDIEETITFVDENADGFGDWVETALTVDVEGCQAGDVLAVDCHFVYVPASSPPTPMARIGLSIAGGAVASVPGTEVELNAASVRQVVSLHALVTVTTEGTYTFTLAGKCESEVIQGSFDIEAGAVLRVIRS